MIFGHTAGRGGATSSGRRSGGSVYRLAAQRKAREAREVSEAREAADA